MIRKLSAPILMGALLLIGLGADPRVSVSAQQDDEHAGLPDAPGREEVAAYCGACHSLNLVVQQGLTRQAWTELLVWMVEEQGMPELDTAEHKLVIDYLAKYVGPDDQKARLRRRGLLP